MSCRKIPGPSGGCAPRCDRRIRFGTHENFRAILSPEATLPTTMEPTALRSIMPACGNRCLPAMSRLSPTCGGQWGFGAHLATSRSLGRTLATAAQPEARDRCPPGSRARPAGDLIRFRRQLRAMLSSSGCFGAHTPFRAERCVEMHCVPDERRQRIAAPSAILPVLHGDRAETAAIRPSTALAGGPAIG